MAVLFYLFFCWGLLTINKSLRLIALEKFSVVKQDRPSGHVYILDGGYIRVFATSRLDRQIYNFTVSVAGEVKMFEIIRKVESVQILICSGNFNVECYLVDVEQNRQQLIYLDISARVVVNQTTPKNSVICNPKEENSSATVYFCVIDNCATNHLTRRNVHLVKFSHVNRKMEVVCSSFELNLKSVRGYCDVTIFSYRDIVFFLLNTKTTSRVITHLVQIRHDKPGKLSYVVILLDHGSNHPSVMHSTLYMDSEFGNYLVSLCKNENDKMNFQHLSMATVDKYLRSALSMTKQLSTPSAYPEIIHSTRVLRFRTAPWYFVTPPNPIDFMVVASRHGSAVAYYTFMNPKNQREFMMVKLGSNSNFLKWKETHKDGNQDVLNMWTNGSTLTVALKQKILSLDTAACTYSSISDCYHDIECVWCEDPPSNCSRKDTCSKPMDVNELVSPQPEIVPFKVDGINPDIGFSCGNSVVLIKGENLDLAKNITVTIDGVESIISRDMSTATGIEVLVPAIEEATKSTSLVVYLPKGPRKFDFTYLDCPYIPNDHTSLNTSSSGGFELILPVRNIGDIKESDFFVIEIAFVYNGTIVATSQLKSVNVPESFTFFAPSLQDYVGKRLHFALAAPTYHLIDRPNATPNLYGSVSDAYVEVYEDPVIEGIYVEQDREITNIVQFEFSDKAGKLHLKGRNIMMIGKSDIEVFLEIHGKCTNVTTDRSSLVSCDLPWPDSIYGRSVTYDIRVNIGRNLIYYPGRVTFKGTNKTTTIFPDIELENSTTRNINENSSSSSQTEVLIPSIGVTLAIIGCCVVVAFLRYHKRSKRRGMIVRDLHSQVSYRNNHVTFSDGRPSLHGTSQENSSTEAFFAEDSKDSTQWIIKSMEEKGLILKKRDLNIDTLIGRGNFGAVYKGTLYSDQGQIEIAVKTLKRDKPENMDVNQFLKEAFVMKDLHHLNVMTLHGVCLDAGDMPLVVLPYMKHGDLLSYLQEERHIPTVRDLVQFGLDIAQGMEYLASLKFVHRDLAARNCMLEVNHRVKVADFGLTRDIYESSYYSIRSKNTKLPVKWMAVESLSVGEYSEKTDMWSFGITLWELMTRGVRPYAAVDSWDMEAYLRSGRRLQQPVYCPSNLYKLMRKCWSLNPEDRPTFTDVKNWISELLMRVHHHLGDMEGTRNIENTYVNLSKGTPCKYENFRNF